MKTYDPTQVSIIIGGAIIKSWDIIAVAMAEDKNTFTPSTTGQLTRTKNANKQGTFTLTLPQASEDNAVLSGLLKVDGVIPCAVIDTGGFSIHSMAEGVIVKSPDAEYGKESGTREWMITGSINDPQVVGGN
jgi:hypothetical protein